MMRRTDSQVSAGSHSLEMRRRSEPRSPGTRITSISPTTNLPRVAMLSLHSSPLARLGARKAGGMNVYVRELARELGRRGAHVDVFTRRTSVDEPQIVEIGERARVISLDAGVCGGCDDGDALLPHVSEFAGRVRDFARCAATTYDVIHSHYWLSGVAALELRRAWSAPIVQMFHTLGAMKNRIAPDKRIAEGSAARLRAEEELLRTADAIIAATPRDRAQMQSFSRERRGTTATNDHGDTHTHDAPIEVIPCGVDANNFRPLDRRDARATLGLPACPAKLLLFVGRIEPLKGLDTLLRALAMLRARRGDSTPTLVVVGGAVGRSASCGATEERRLQALVRELDLSAHVFFAGARPHEELPLYYNAADLLVAPSHYESFGMVALEAQACGTPVVASRVGGLTFTVEDNVTGLLAPWHDPAAFADRIDRLLADDDLRRRMGERARQQAARYDWSQIAARALDLYARVSVKAAHTSHPARAVGSTT